MLLAYECEFCEGQWFSLYAVTGILRLLLCYLKGNLALNQIKLPFILAQFIV